MTTNHKDDGGAAFPCQPLGASGMPLCEHQPGMTLLDYFAIHCLPQ